MPGRFLIMIPKQMQKMMKQKQLTFIWKTKQMMRNWVIWKRFGIILFIMNYVLLLKNILFY